MIFHKRLNKYYFQYLHFFFIGVIALLAVDYAQLYVPTLFGDIIDGIATGTMATSYLRKLVFQIVIIAVVLFVGRFLWRIGIFGNSIRISSALRDELFTHMERLPQNYYSQTKTGALLALYTNDTYAIRLALGQGLVISFDILFLSSLALYKMFMINWRMTLFSCIPLLSIGVLGIIFGRLMQNKFLERQQAYADLSDITQESFSGMKVIKAFNRQQTQNAKFYLKNREYRDRNLRYLRISLFLNFGVELLILLIISFILGYGGYLVVSKATFGATTFTIGRLAEFLGLFASLTYPLLSIGRVINLTSQGKASLKRIDNVLSTRSEVTDPEHPIKIAIQGAIYFNHLTFKYPDSAEPALADLTFTIERGEHIGIIGRTGSGKTTISEVLLRLYNIERGMVYLDGIDIMDIAHRDVREAIAYVPQDNFLFSDTIMNNINFNRKVTQTFEAINAAKSSQVHDDIIEFQRGYETVLGEQGANVSGGQRQRIALARAFVKDAPILILDDSVSALDSKTEEVLLNNIHSLRRGKTTLFISHRISAVKACHKIVYIKEGKIFGVGTHEELYRTNPEYRAMSDLQKLAGGDQLW